MIIGYQGIQGSYSEEVLIRYYPIYRHKPFITFNHMMQACRNSEIDAALLPIENTTGGSIKKAYLLMLTSSLFINAEINYNIHHCLLANKLTTMRKIKYVMSHPEALLQCRKYIEIHNFVAKEFRDTAESALYISRHQYTSIAAITSKRCADIYNLQILDENIEDISCNTTRFLLVSQKYSEKEHTKLTATFKLPHTPGSLFKALEIIAVNEFNLTKIESCPIPDQPYHYAFVVDIDIKDKNWRKLISQLSKKVLDFKILGVYSTLNT